MIPYIATTTFTPPMRALQHKSRASFFTQVYTPFTTPAPLFLYSFLLLHTHQLYRCKHKHTSNSQA